MDHQEPYSKLPIKFEEYGDFLAVNITNKTHVAVLARDSGKAYYCLQLRYISDGHLIRALSANLSKTQENAEAEKWLHLIQLFFSMNPQRFPRLVDSVSAMEKKAPTHSNAASDLKQFLTKWEGVQFTMNIIPQVLQYNTPVGDLLDLYTDT